MNSTAIGLDNLIIFGKGTIQETIYRIEPDEDCVLLVEVDSIYIKNSIRFSSLSSLEDFIKKNQNEAQIAVL